jgi:integrase
LRVDVFPALGELRPEDVTRGDIRGLISKIADRAPTQANRTFAAIRRVFSWAIGEDLLVASPCAGLKMPAKEQPRDRVYSNEEIRAIFAAVPGTELEHLVSLIFFTGVRSEEARSARWSELDLESKLWTIPREKSKNRESHPVPLSEGALRVVEGLKRAVGNEFLFLAPTKTGFMDHPQKAIVRVRESSKVADFRLHDVRRTVATRLAQLGALDAIVEAVLGHTPPKLKRTYNRYQPVREMRSALQAWSAHLERIVAGQAAAAARVLPMANAGRPTRA